MNLIEAIKSGRPYRRLCWSLDNWRKPFPCLSEAYTERLEDLLADDWEIQEPKVTITRSQFLRAWSVASSACGDDGTRYIIAETVMRKLGLED